MVVVGDGTTEQGRKVAQHWSHLAVTYDGVMQFLEQKGISVGDVTAEDLHAVDMIHMGGLPATDELATMAGISEGHCILDVGSGVGGPARRLAAKFGADVIGLELSQTLCDTATRLTELVGLREKVRFEQGSALALPFEDKQFEVLVMQHVAMQISEKEQLFSELTRVVKQGGKLAMHEIFSGKGELHYPLAWAKEPSMSALEPLDACMTRLSEIGFETGEFVDQSEAGRAFHQKNIENYNAALAQDEGAEGLTADVVRARLAASVAMETNLRTGSLKVGMLVARRSI